MPRPNGFAAAVPLYYQLAGILREHIVSGKYLAGDRLPTEEALSKDYDVSRITIRQALGDLEKEGFIKREAGRGTFVADRRTFSNTFRMEGSLEDLISMGLSTSVKVLTLATIKASASEADFLRINLGDPLVRCTRLRLHGGTEGCSKHTPVRPEPVPLVVADLWLWRRRGLRTAHEPQLH